MKLLWELQELEREIAFKEDEMRKIPSVQIYRSQKNEVSSLQESLSSQQEKMEVGKKKMRREEMNLQNVNASIAVLNNKLYGGEVQSTRELENMEKKLSALQTEQSAIEDEILSLMEEMEKDELKTSELCRQEEKEQARLQKVKAQAQKELQAARQELAKLNERRNGIMEQLEAPLLQKYQDLSRKMQGQCVSLVKEGFCGICNVSLPSAFRARILTPGQLVFCENCGSLLVLGD